MSYNFFLKPLRHYPSECYQKYWVLCTDYGGRINFIAWGNYQRTRWTFRRYRSESEYGERPHDEFYGGWSHNTIIKDIEEWLNRFYKIQRAR